MHCHQFAEEKRNEPALLDSGDSPVSKTKTYFSFIRDSLSPHFLSDISFQRWWVRRKETLRKENPQLEEFAEVLHFHGSLFILAFLINLFSKYLLHTFVLSAFPLLFHK